ncbi:Pol Polyprotein [Phytophthora megakarya]|uniref:Pol Polyprotein n=1 Tax=Phytophthora megakarya TaxID=4795 RepID=A0A225UH48_9STRA|nr:Pol Polyprotein [Phytophthora megakarya]
MSWTRGSPFKQWTLSRNDKQSFDLYKMQIAASADGQKLNADNVGRGNTNEFKIGSLVLLSTQYLPTHAVYVFGASKLAPRFIRPFTVAERHGSAYTLELPSDMRLHPTFYVGRLKPYMQPESSSRDGSPTTTRGATSASPQASSPSPGEGELVPTPQHGSASATEAFCTFSCCLSPAI